MCFTNDQRPPDPPRSSDIGQHGRLELTAIDGNGFAAYDAVPVTRRGASLVLLPDIRGPAHILADAHEAAARLRGRSDDPVFTLGFCKFGAESWRLSATDLGAAGCIGFYGMPAGVLQDIPAMASPLLVLAAGADQATSLEGNQAFDRALTEAGKKHEYVIYEGAPHSFFDRSFSAWTKVCEDAWLRMLGFIERNR